MPARYDAVYIMYPRGFRTGGPEALYQLGAALQELGIPSFMVPLPFSRDLPRIADYDAYGVPEADEATDAAGCAIVVSEGNYYVLARYRRAERFCWWLSINNSQLYHFGLMTKTSTKPNARLRNVARRAIHVWEIAGRPIALRLPVHHLTQSAFAWAFLHSRANVLPSMLSDYTTLSAEAPTQQSEINPRQISYNFAKGGYLVQRVIDSRMVDADWVAIKDMSQAQVAKTLRSSSVYLDLGHQPGKDRLPREAASAGAVTIVARVGAGAYHLDFPLPYEHKIIVDRDLTTTASRVLNNVLIDRERAFALQEAFRHTIVDERATFYREVKRIFVDGQFGSDFEFE